MTHDFTVWMWDRYPDGGKYLHSYEFQGFDKNVVWRNLSWFFLVDALVYVYLLLPEKNRLHRKDSVQAIAAAADDRLMSMDSDIDENLLESQRYKILLCVELMFSSFPFLPFFFSSFIYVCCAFA